MAHSVVVLVIAVALWVKKVRGQDITVFRQTTSSKFPSGEVMELRHKCSFAAKVFPKRGVSGADFVFSEDNFPSA